MKINRILRQCNQLVFTHKLVLKKRCQLSRDSQNLTHLAHVIKTQKAKRMHQDYHSSLPCMIMMCQKSWAYLILLLKS